MRRFADSGQVKGPTQHVGLVMLLLADNASARTNTRMRRIAHASGVSYATVRRAVSALVALGFLQRVDLERGEGCDFQWLAPIADPLEQPAASSARRIPPRSPSLGNGNGEAAHPAPPPMPAQAAPEAVDVPFAGSPAELVERIDFARKAWSQEYERAQRVPWVDTTNTPPTFWLESTLWAQASIGHAVGCSWKRSTRMLFRAYVVERDLRGALLPLSWLRARFAQVVPEATRLAREAKAMQEAA